MRTFLGIVLGSVISAAIVALNAWREDRRNSRWLDEVTPDDKEDECSS